MAKPSLPIAPGFRFCTNTSAFAIMAANSFLSSSLVEIENDRFLAAIEPDEVGALAVHDMIVAAREIAFRTLHLDHARAGIRHPAGALRRRDRLFERDDEDAGEREGSF